MTEDVGTTRRARLSPRDRLQVWEAHKGVCCICKAKIDGVRERWIVEHVRALELGGADERSNMAPAHEACGIEKTKSDHSRGAKAKRAKARHLGIKKPSSFQGWRRFDGTPVRNPKARTHAD